MIEYNSEEKEILKRVKRDYISIKKDIDLLINDNKNMKQILDFVEKNIDCDITNCEFLDDYKYIDINCKDMTITIVKDGNEPIQLGAFIEVWNDKGNYYMGRIEFEELERLVSSYE